MPDIREYERAVTTTANAYVQPLIESYLDRLSAGLRSGGVAVDPFLIGSDAGRVARPAAIKYPVRLVESGPAGGAVAASFVARRSDITQVIAFDMGGTTAKMCVIDDGEPAHTDSFEVARVSRFAKGSGLPLKVPVIEMIEIGAGGGSIARVDDRGLLQVGPESSRRSSGSRLLRIWGHPSNRHRCGPLPWLSRSRLLSWRRHASRCRGRRKCNSAADRATAGADIDVELPGASMRSSTTIWRAPQRCTAWNAVKIRVTMCSSPMVAPVLCTHGRSPPRWASGASCIRCMPVRCRRSVFSWRLRRSP